MIISDKNKKYSELLNEFSFICLLYSLFNFFYYNKIQGNKTINLNSLNNIFLKNNMFFIIFQNFFKKKSVKYENKTEKNKN